MTMKLLTDAGGGTNGDAIEPGANDINGRTRRLSGTLFVTGTFNGANAGLELSPNGTEWVRATDLTLAGPGAVNIEFWTYRYRAFVEGGDTSTAVTIHIEGAG
mgnify:CR=1 FL=1